MINKLKEKTACFKNDKNPVFHILRYLMINRYGFPCLFIHWPVIFCRLIKALFGRSAKERVYAYTSFDLWLRNYYNKVARNFRQAGRFGYVWDEGLGMTMGPRFFANYMTYALYGKLSCRKFSAFSLILYLAAVGIAGYMFGDPKVALVMIIFLVISPGVLFSLVGHMVKPEVIWWPFGLFAMAAAFEGQWPIVWMMSGLLLLANTSVGFITVFMLIAPFIKELFGAGQWPGGWWFIAVVPGILKQLWRFQQAWRQGFLSATVNEQKRVTHGFSVSLSELDYIVSFIIVPFVLTGWGNWINGLITGISVIVFYFLNSRLVKIADTVTVRLLVFSAVSAVAVVSGTWISLLGVILCLYARPVNYAVESARKQDTEKYKQDLFGGEPLAARVKQHELLLKDYPWLYPMQFPSPGSIMEIFSRIPEGSRIIMEGDGDSRRKSRYWRFRNWTDAFLPQRNIEFLNHTFLMRMSEFDLTQQYLDCFSYPALKPEVMRDVCGNLGVSFVITFTDSTASALQKIGFCREIEVSFKDFSGLADILHMPSYNLTLLSAPGNNSIINPAVSCERLKNKITWEAKGLQSYLIRYRYHTCFIAQQGNQRLEITPVEVFAGMPLRFMKVHAPKDGLVSLTFVLNPL